jgi:outer membrane biosynthesis protein TonB
MDDPNRLEAKGLARAKIRAKRRRVQTIRRRTLRGSLVLFAVVWAILFAQLASGNDPALSRAPVADRRAAAHTPPPRAEFAPEAEPEAMPEEEFVPEPEAEEEFAPEPEAEAEFEPEPIVTSTS